LSSTAAAPDAAAAETESGLPPAGASISIHEVVPPDLSSVRVPTTLDFANRRSQRTTDAARASAPNAKVQTEPTPKPPGSAPAADANAVQARDPSVVATPASPLSKTRDFIQRVWQHALDAAQAVGIKPQFIVGQAALESGWGQHEIRNTNGATTHNVFGVKAGKDWSGPVVERTTTEYVNGVAQKTTAKFRVYSSYAESFRDYTNVLRSNPRYSSVVGQSKDAAGFARGLQKAGYATDPAYADKLMRLINGPSLKQAASSLPPTQAAAKIDVNA
jgi:flagellar protein FlgJ